MIVVVAADLIVRDRGPREIEAGDARRLRRQERALDVARDRQFLRAALREDSNWKVTFNKDFAAVIENCTNMPRFTTNKNGERVAAGAWLSQTFIDNYIALHKAGYAHSVEVWNGGRLVAGLYGVFADGVFGGESMFHLVDAEGRRPDRDRKSVV